MQPLEDSDEDVPPPVPVTIITGFLGAGKQVLRTCVLSALNPYQDVERTCSSHSSPGAEVTDAEVTDASYVMRASLPRQRYTGHRRACRHDARQPGEHRPCTLYCVRGC